MAILDRIALVLAIIGGLNWGSIGLFSFDLVAWACGGQTALLSRIIYTLVGLSALWCGYSIIHVFLQNIARTIFDDNPWRFYFTVVHVRRCRKCNCANSVLFRVRNTIYVSACVTNVIIAISMFR